MLVSVFIKLGITFGYPPLWRIFLTWTKKTIVLNFGNSRIKTGFLRFHQMVVILLITFLFFYNKDIHNKFSSSTLVLKVKLIERTFYLIGSFGIIGVVVGKIDFVSAYQNDTFILRSPLPILQ